MSSSQKLKLHLKYSKVIICKKKNLVVDKYRDFLYFSSLVHVIMEFFFGIIS